MPKSVCVVGAGVSGLTCAIRIAEAGHTVEILTREIGSQTTSSVAAAFWYPFWTGKEPDHRWYKRSWARRTYKVFEAILETDRAGVSKTNLYEYFSERMSDEDIEKVIQSMWWRKLPKVGYRDLGPEELEGRAVRNRRFKRGIFFKTFVVNMSDYLQYLRERLNNDFGVKPQDQTVDDLRGLAQRYDAVINCTGMGAKTLVPDTNMKAKEGVVLQLTPLPQITDIFLIHTGPYFETRPMYIVPRRGSCPDIILGGTITARFAQGERKALQAQHLAFDDLSESHWARKFTSRILKDCSAFERELENATVLNVQVGYRPARDPKVRLGKEGNIIHNYGHAGGGVTLSWGCAEHVARLLQRIFLR